MIHHHDNRKKRLASRILSVCLALALLCSVALPVYATAPDGGSDIAGQEVTISEPAESTVDKPSGDEEKQSDISTETDSQTEEDEQESSQGQDSKQDQASGDTDSGSDTSGASGASGASGSSGASDASDTSDTDVAGGTEEKTGEAGNTDTVQSSGNTETVNNTLQTVLPKSQTFDLPATLADTDDIVARYTLEVGDSMTLSGSTGSSHTWTQDSDDGGMLQLSSNRQSTATITAKTAGTVYVTHTYYVWENWTRVEKQEVFEIIINPESDTIKVYVYVAGSDYSEECLELLGIDPSTLDGNGYFPAGEIELDKSYLEGKANVTTPGAALINSTNDWNAVLAALGNLNTSTLTNNDSADGKDYSKNQGNNVGDYLSQAAGDVGYNWGTQRTALFYWNWDSNHSFGFTDQSVKYHLDLRFNTNKITFITGENGITSGAAQDGTTVDSRTYITGSKILEPRNLTIPDGYRLAGYYSDPDFTTPWDGIGTPLTSDQTVYIKIVPLEDVILYYKNVSGSEAGTLSSDSEGVNPKTGVAAGSKATANDGYEFDGWYEDEACTKLISEDASFVPEKPTDGWKDGTTYYAKFVRKTQDITVKKIVSGGLGDREKGFSFTYSYTDPKDTTKTPVTGTFTLKHDGTTTISSVPVGAALTITESNSDYSVSAVYGSQKLEVTYVNGDNASNSTASVTITVAKDVSDVTITNLKDINPDMGIMLDSFPYILVLLLIFAGAVAFVFCRRRGHKA